jgi:hypothetical protein
LNSALRPANVGDRKCSVIVSFDTRAILLRSLVFFLFLGTTTCLPGFMAVVILCSIIHGQGRPFASTLSLAQDVKEKKTKTSIGDAK